MTSGRNSLVFAPCWIHGCVRTIIVVSSIAVGLCGIMSHSATSTISPESVSCKEYGELRWMGTVRMVAVLDGCSA